MTGSYCLSKSHACHIYITSSLLQRVLNSQHVRFQHESKRVRRRWSHSPTAHSI